MKIALCMSGHARTYDKTYQFWYDHLLSNYDVDIHLHLWDTIGPRSFGVGRSEDNPLPRDDFDSGILPSLPTNENNHLWDLWKPTTLTLDSYDQYHQSFSHDIKPILDERDRRNIAAGFEHHHPLSVRSMLFKRWQCNQIINRWEQPYDVVINTRMDVVPAKPMNIVVPAALQFHGVSNTMGDELLDYGCIGTPNMMNVWCNLYKNQLKLLEQMGAEENFFTFLNPHKMYIRYLNEQHQPYVELDLGLCIVRDNGRLLGYPHDTQLVREKLK